MPQPSPPRRAATFGLWLHGALLRAAHAFLPAAPAVWRRTAGFMSTRTLGALAEHGVFDALDGRRATATTLAGELGLHADTLHRLLRGAAVDGFVRVDRRGRFRLTRLGRALRTDAPGSMRPWLLYLNREATQAAWARVGASLVDGEPSFPAVHGQSVWGHFADHPEEEREFAAAMRNLTAMILPFVAASYPWPERGTVCDVAGGVGTLLASVLEARPDLQGVLVDGPGPLAEAPAFLRAAGVDARVELVQGDIFAGFEARTDVYLLKDVLHDWDDERSVAILRTVRDAAPAGARVVLVEMLLDRDGLDPIVAFEDLHMLTQCDGGRQRSGAELQGLLREAGLTPQAIRRTAGPALVDAIVAG
jgi:hypothetical protein